MLCNACGTSNPDSAVFCSRCGQPIRGAAPQPPGPPPFPQSWPPAGVQPAPPPRPGLGGGLLFLVIYLVFVNPLWTLWTLLQSIAVGASWRIYEVMIHVGIGSTASASAAMFFLFSFLNLVSAAWGLYAGIQLWKFQPGAVGKTKLYLLIGGLALNALGVLANTSYYIRLARYGELSRAAQPIIVLAISLMIEIAGLIYLSSSRRVAAAYRLA